MKNVDYGPNIELLQINAEINQGNSGGPLLNEKGEVVGINTYCVLNSQGIFGAISASELITFIDSNHLFDITTAKENGVSWILITLVLLVLIAVVVCGIIYLPRFRNKMNKKRAKKELLLSDYLIALEFDIDANMVVSLMMPIIIYLRNKHNDGSVFLKLSPSRLVVTKDGCMLIDSKDNTSDEFIAPEQKNGTYAGIRADIYSVCAIMRYMLTYKYRIQARKNINTSSEELWKIIDKGLSEKAEDRFENMQELILLLSPFNTGINEQELSPFELTPNNFTAREVQTGEHFINSKKLKDIRKRKRTFVIIGVGIALVIFVGYSAINYMLATNNAKNGMFREAYTEICNIPYLQAFFADDYEYIIAGVDMLDRDYDKAISRLEELGNYSGAEELIFESKYRKAGMLADQKNYTEAISIYKEIEEFKDSDPLIDDTMFRKASYLISIGDFESAKDILIELSDNKYIDADSKLKELYYTWGCYLLDDEQKILQAYDKFNLAGDYEDAEQIIPELKDYIYYSAIDDYHSDSYFLAKKKFEKIEYYLDSNMYLILIQAHQTSVYDFDASALWPMIGFEDASELIMSNDYFAQSFLLGRWKGDSRYFIMKEDGHISYDIPWFNYGDYYTIEDGKILKYKEETPEITKTLFEIIIIDQNCIQITSYENYETYILYRQ